MGDVEYPVHKVRSLQDRVRAVATGCDAIEQAAQRLAGILAGEFDGTVALARVYATLEFESLPPESREFVSDLARSKDVEDLLLPETPVFALLGTRGVEPEWNDRMRSRRHVAIPLVSAEFVGKIPMFATLLSELGLPPSWTRGRVDRIQVDHLLGGGGAGVFYVPDARTAKDPLGRFIIGEQDFVKKHGIQTVFGMGGAWPNGSVVACIVFLRRVVDLTVVRRLAPLVGVFRAATNTLAANGDYFLAP
jgi:hypothetical protein